MLTLNCEESYSPNSWASRTKIVMNTTNICKTIYMISMTIF